MSNTNSQNAARQEEQREELTELLAAATFASGEQRHGDAAEILSTVAALATSWAEEERSRAQALAAYLST
jgi:hypothetical protein